MSRLSLLLLASSLAACSTEQSVDEHLFEGPVDRVVLDIASANVDIVAVDGLDGARIVSEVQWMNERPEVVLDLVDGQLRVETGCPRSFANPKMCAVDLTVEVPADADVFGSLSSGNVSIAGLRGALDLSFKSGNTSLRSLEGAVAIDVGSGNVTGHELSVASLVVHVGSGNVEIEQSVAPDAVFLEAGAGNLSLVLPGGAYDVSTTTDWGDVSVSGVDHSASAAASIDLHTGSGNVTLDGR